MRSRRKKTKRWSDLSPRQKQAVVATGIVQNLLLGAALIDLKRRPADEVKGDKRLWAAAAFVNFIGPIAYFTFGRKRQAGG